MSFPATAVQFQIGIGRLLLTVQYRNGIKLCMTLAEWMNVNAKTREEVAASLQVSEVSVGRYLTGARRPKPMIVLKIKAMTKGLVTADDFLSLESSPRAA